MRRGAAAALLFATLLLTGTPVAPQAAAAQPAGRLSLAAQTAWVRPGGPFQLRLDVEGIREPDALEIAVSVHRQIRTRSQFARTVDGELLGRTLATRVAAVEDLRFGPGGALVTLSVASLSAGVYPVSVVLRDAGGRTLDDFTTHLVRLPDEAVDVPLSVAWVQPLRGEPSLQPDGTRRLDPAELERLRAVGDALREAPSVTLDATPEVLEALEAQGETGVLDALRGLRADGEVLTTPFVDLDVAALEAAGLGPWVATQRTAGEAVLRRLLETAGQPRTWSVDDAFDRRAIGRLKTAGVSRVVVDEDALEPLDPGVTGGITLAQPFRLPAPGGPVEAASVDAALVDHLRHEDPVLGAHQLLADLAVLYFDAPGTERGVVVRPPEDWEPAAELLTIVFRALATSVRPILHPVTVDELFATVEPLTDGGEVVERRPVGEIGEIGVAAARVHSASDSVSAFRSLAGPDHEQVPVLQELLLVSLADGLRPAARREYLAEVEARVQGVRGDVRLGPGRTYRLTAREGTIPVTFINDNDFPVTATLVLASDKLEFEEAGDDDRSRLVIPDIRLAPGTTTRAVPVRSRTSGLFRLQATLYDAESRSELFRTSYSVRSMVASGVGIILSVGAILFLLLWWGSHWRTVRRDRRLVGAGPRDAAPVTPQ